MSTNPWSRQARRYESYGRELPTDMSPREVNLFKSHGFVTIDGRNRHTEDVLAANETMAQYVARTPEIEEDNVLLREAQAMHRLTYGDYEEHRRDLNTDRSRHKGFGKFIPNPRAAVESARILENSKDHFGAFITSSEQARNELRILNGLPRYDSQASLPPRHSGPPSYHAVDPRDNPESDLQTPEGRGRRRRQHLAPEESDGDRDSPYAPASSTTYAGQGYDYQRGDYQRGETSQLYSRGASEPDEEGEYVYGETEPPQPTLEATRRGRQGRRSPQ